IPQGQRFRQRRSRVSPFPDCRTARRAIRGGPFILGRCLTPGRFSGAMRADSALPISRFMSDPTFFLVAALAVFLVGLSKSGLVASLGVVGVPLLTLVIPARDAAGMMLPLLIVMDM